MCWPASLGHIRSMDREVDVLVVDDDPDILALLSGVLTELGLRVATASNGRTGLEQARRLLPYLVLSDVMMPIMRGDRMVEALRADPATADIRCVLMSAAARDTSGDTYFFPKPFDLSHLERLVMEWIPKPA